MLGVVDCTGTEMSFQIPYKVNTANIRDLEGEKRSHAISLSYSFVTYESWFISQEW